MTTTVYFVDMFYCSCRHDDNYNCLTSTSIPVLTYDEIRPIWNSEFFTVLKRNYKNDSNELAIIKNVIEIRNRKYFTCPCGDCKEAFFDFIGTREAIVENIDKDLSLKMKTLNNKPDSIKEKILKGIIKKYRLPDFP